MSTTSRQLEVLVLGRPEIRMGGRPLVEIVSVKAKALLIYLAVTGTTWSRSALAGLLWGDMPEESARANLRLALTKLRGAVGDHLSTTRRSVAFDASRPHFIDALEFAARVSAPEPGIENPFAPPSISIAVIS